MNGILKKLRVRLARSGRMEKDFQYFANAARVLDLGCGRGSFLKLLAGRGVGVDGSQDHVESCRNSGLDARQVMLPGRLPFPDGHFDGVHCSHFIEHFGPSDALAVLREIDRVLHPGGILLIRTPLLSPAFYDDPTHVRPYHLHCILHFLGGWEEPGSRQAIFGSEEPRYELRSYYEEVYPWYTSTVAPTISPSRFPMRLALRGISHLLATLGIGRRGAYGAVLVKTRVSRKCVVQQDAA
jgi:SAM-dependent methyltransferase